MFCKTLSLLEVMIIKFKSLRIFGFVCSDFGGGWLGQQKSEHCSDFEIRWKKWTLPYGDRETKLSNLLEGEIAKSMLGKLNLKLNPHPSISVMMEGWGPRWRDGGPGFNLF